MPEMPDIAVYIEALEKRILHRRLEKISILHPFLLRTADISITEVEGNRAVGLRRLGKRIAVGLEDELWLVVHLMIAGRLQWRESGFRPKGKQYLAAFDFQVGSLVLTEAGSKRRASLHIVRGETSLSALNPGGLDVLQIEHGGLSGRLTRSNHTLKRALTDPRFFCGIGNAYSDEILFRAGLSPLAMTQKLGPGEIDNLYRVTRDTLTEWIDRLRREAGDGFPENVTAFHRGMFVHGRYGKPCAQCGTSIQRIRYATRETNYCPKCQTNGRLLADRSMSRVLKNGWPRTLGECEQT